MKFLKHNPLVVVLALIVLGAIAGVFCGDLYYQREVKAWEAYWDFPPYWLSNESAYGFMIIGGFIGVMICLAIGMVAYVVVVRSEPESHTALNLSNTISRR